MTPPIETTDRDTPCAHGTEGARLDATICSVCMHTQADRLDEHRDRMRKAERLVALARAAGIKQILESRRGGRTVVQVTADGDGGIVVMVATP